MKDILFDQHFLIDQDIIKKAVKAAEIKSTDNVLEIGGGTGNITAQIPKCDLTVVELDETLAEELKKRFKHANIIQGNILELGDRLEHDVIISALPYSLCEPIFRTLFLSKFRTAVLVLPEKFISGIKEDDTPLSYIARAFLDIEIIELVPPQAFSPEPKVSSVIARITKKSPSSDEKIIQDIYWMNHKKLKNAIRDYLLRNTDLTKKIIAEKLEKSGMHENTLEKNVKLLRRNEFEKVIEFIKNEKTA